MSGIHRRGLPSRDPRVLTSPDTYQYGDRQLTSVFRFTDPLELSTAFGTDAVDRYRQISPIARLSILYIVSHELRLSYCSEHLHNYHAKMRVYNPS